LLLGCYVQVSKEEVSAIPEIDICLGTNEKANIVKFVENYKKEQELVVEDVFENPEYTEFGTVTYTENTRAVIKIQDGCDRFCSYCLIPYARGRVRSRKPEAVVKEIENIAKNGIKEVVITGIHIASYGKDLKNGFKLIDLLEEINKIDGIKRIRLRIN
jgi:threonylcarbamoyladenosine tRNA methylthiotransferase MtaB